MEKPNPSDYNSTGFYLDDLEKYNHMKEKSKEEILSDAHRFFDNNHVQFSGVNAGLYLEEEDFIEFVKSIVNAAQYKGGVSDEEIQKNNLQYK